ncbi:MAG: pyrroline-5-carboxylate reductase [Alphaproteobacteria bacterium]|nr:pyrroline-5-carboxylate reductase [Alphaproteobacteria bacterium]
MAGHQEALSVVLVGCGKMGGALLESWLGISSLEADFSVVEPHDIPFESLRHYRDLEEAQSALKHADLVVLAVKPQVMKDVCESLKGDLNPKALVLSIAAGQSLSQFTSYLGEASAVIRTMPNLPATIGKGMSVAVANAHVTTAQKALASQLLEASGRLEWVQDEALLNAVTAVSGSGPAYVFLLVEVLAQAGIKAGLDEALAMTLARQTIIGSAGLLEAARDTETATLRENVTSPGGTTQAALEVLMNGELQALFDAAIEAAARRGAELGS